MDISNEISQNDLSVIRTNLAKSFNLNELQTLCFELELNFENIEGLTLETKTIGIVNYCVRHGKLVELIRYCKKARPLIKWPVLGTQQEDSVYEEQVQLYLRELEKDINRYLNQVLANSYVDLDYEEDDRAIPQKRIDALPKFFFTSLENEIDQKISRVFTNLRTAVDEFFGRVLLLGEPGGGKTTSLFSFANSAISGYFNNAGREIPVLVPVASWSPKSSPSLLEWLEEQLPLLPRPTIEHLFSANRLLILLDGLDELGPEYRDEQSKQHFDPRKKFLEILPTDNHIVVSCRTKDYEDIKFKPHLNGAVVLQPLNDNQRRLYLSNQPKLLASIEADRGLQEITRNPLMLSAFAFAYKESSKDLILLNNLQQGELRDKILRAYIEKRYRREARRLGESIVYNLSDIYNILGPIAMDDAGGYGNMNMFPNRTLQDQLKEEDVKRFLDFMLLLRILVSERHNSFRFSHLLLRDHFAFTQALISLKDGKGSVRDSAAWALWQIPDERAIDALVDALKDQDRYARGSAAGALGKIGNPIALPALQRLLSDNTSVYSIYGNSIAEVASTAIKMIEEAQENRASLESKQRRLQILNTYMITMGKDCPLEIINEIEQLKLDTTK
jgi:hypothetical protein